MSNPIEILPDNVYLLGGIETLGSQIVMAFYACHSITRATALADEENGGNGDIDLTDIEHASLEAADALGAEAMTDVIYSAREVNDFETETWPHSNQIAAENEGWAIFNLDEPDMRLERDDESSILEDDLAAYRLVFLIDTPLHLAARELLLQGAAEHHGHITEYIEGLLTGVTA